MPVPARYLCYALALLGLGFALACIAPRLSSAWPLEWMEGASLEHALRILHGQPLYAAPSGEFTAFVYPPLSYLPMALACALFGPSLFAARAASLLALLVCLVSLGRTATRLAGERAAGWLAAGLFALGYGYTGGFMDLARVDATFMALVLLGCERLSAARNRSAFACFVLACFAKQHGLLLLTAAALFLVLREGRRALPVIAGAALALFGAGFALHMATDGWFLRYVLYVPAAHGLEPSLLVSYLGVDLALYLPVLCVLAITGGVDHWQRRVLCSTDLLLLAAIAASALGRAHPGGDDNVRLPGYALLALVASSAFCARVRSASPRARLLWCGALGLQAVMLLQSPALHWPTHAQAKALSRLRRELTRCAHGAPSVALDHAGLTGTPFVHTMAWSDLATSRPEYAIVAATAITSALRAPDGPAALAVSTASPALRQLLAANYHVCARLPALRLPTGYRIGPTVVYARGVAAPDDAGGL